MIVGHPLQKGQQPDGQEKGQDGGKPVGDAEGSLVRPADAEQEVRVHDARQYGESIVKTGSRLRDRASRNRQDHALADFR